MQRKLDHILVEKHDALYDLRRISDQQDKATMLSTDTSIFLIVPRSRDLRISNQELVYLAKQLFGKPQRKNMQKYCPNVATSTGLITSVQVQEAPAQGVWPDGAILPRLRGGAG